MTITSCATPLIVWQPVWVGAMLRATQKGNISSACSEGGPQELWLLRIYAQGALVHHPTSLRVKSLVVFAPQDIAKALESERSRLVDLIPAKKYRKRPI